MRTELTRNQIKSLSTNQLQHRLVCEQANNKALKATIQKLRDDLLDMTYEKEKYRCELIEVIEEISNERTPKVG